MVAQPLVWVEVFDKLNKLEDFMESWQKHENAFLFLSFDVLEQVLPLYDITDQN
jgi:hypothetical protein